MPNPVENPARLLAGRVILSGMVSLFVGLALIIIGMFLLERMGVAAGNGFLTAGKIFTGLWLPLVLFEGDRRWVPGHISRSAAMTRTTGFMSSKKLPSQILRALGCAELQVP